MHINTKSFWNFSKTVFEQYRNVVLMAFVLIICNSCNSEEEQPTNSYFDTAIFNGRWVMIAEATSQGGNTYDHGLYRWIFDHENGVLTIEADVNRAFYYATGDYDYEIKNEEGDQNLYIKGKEFGKLIYSESFPDRLIIDAWELLRIKYTFNRL